MCCPLMIIHFDWIHKTSQCLNSNLGVGGGEVRRGRRASICFVFWEEREREISVDFSSHLIVYRRKKIIYIYILFRNSWSVMKDSF
jgi:hypothetical protein